MGDKSYKYVPIGGIEKMNIEHSTSNFQHRRRFIKSIEYIFRCWVLNVRIYFSGMPLYQTLFVPGYIEAIIVLQQETCVCRYNA